MRIVHASDWHGRLMKLPEADLYVFTGDMLENFPVKHATGGGRFWKIVPEVEASEQTALMELWSEGGHVRARLGSPDAPIVCVRGNHDFTDLSPMFKGCNLVHEFRNNEMIELLGLKITGHRGIPEIYNSWNDEVSRPDLKDRFRSMPHADLYLTHYPPAGMLDNSLGPDGGEGGEQYGLEGGLVDFLVYRMTPAVHMFGHIHECGGEVVKIGPVQFSNAATTFNEIDF